MRVFLYISYNGAKFQGFASQPNKKTITDRIVFACKILQIDAVPVGSGRTDAGVHALNQVIHFDLPQFWNDLNKLRNMLNRSLHPFIHVKKILHVRDDLHARFDAQKRLYRYICYHGSFNPFLSEFALFSKSFDIKKIKGEAKLFEGKHDFGFFKKEGTLTKNDIRIIYKTNVYLYKNFTIFYFLGSAFLRSQIRMIVNSLIVEDEKKEEKIILQLEKKEKIYTNLAPACGLYLSRIYYDFSSTCKK